MRRWSVAFGAVVLVGGGGAWASMTLTPGSHDFGQVMLGGSSAVQNFQLTGTAPVSRRGILRVRTGGPDADDFVVDSGWLVAPPTSPGQPPPFPPGSCPSTSWAFKGGSCSYTITFTPRSLGRKTAQLIVDDPGTGETATATLTGEGMFGCRPYLVSCNYADHYAGTFTLTTDDAATSGATSRKGRWLTTIEVKVEQGVATCTGQQDDWEEEWNGGKLDRRFTATGTISGPGLFAIEFRASGRSFEYTLTFACPTADIRTTSVDNLAGTSSAGAIPSEPADWRHASLGADPQPATMIGMTDLTGTQTDLRGNDGSNSGVTGTTTMTWSLKR